MMRRDAYFLLQFRNKLAILSVILRVVPSSLLICNRSET